MPTLRSVRNLACALVLLGCQLTSREGAPASRPAPVVTATTPPALRVVADARSQIGRTTSYDPAYRTLHYPNGDVPMETGVCADVVVRAVRAGGVDLQRAVHEDMARAFSHYPQSWGLRGPDANIDHRRVANLMKFFSRKGYALAVTQQPNEYLPGDIVAWRLSNGRLHIGVVSNDRSADNARPLMVHNIGLGAQQQDVLFAFTVIGHYRMFPPSRA